MPPRPPSEHEMSLAEDDPLLDSDERSDEDTDSLHSHPEPRLRFNSSRWQARSSRQVILLVAFIKFAVVASGMMLLLPLARLIEDLFCHAYYQDTSSEIIEEMKCKLDEIQSRMAYLTGWNSLLNAIVGTTT